jgi:tetraprenyl-beta-curcumene synthase
MTEAGNILLVDHDRSTAPANATIDPNSPRPIAPPAPEHVPTRRAFAGTAGLSTLARASLALVLANVRYWSTVAPLVRGQLARWEHTASSIPDPALRTLAGDKLRDEHFNAQVAATLATLAPRAHRAHVVEAIVALQVLYDYLDVLGEQPATGWVGSNPNDRALLAALTDAVTLPTRDDPDSNAERPRDYYRDRPHSDDGGYLQALAETVRTALAGLPNAAVIAPVAGAAATRCAEAQVLNHQASRTGIDELRKWATPRAAGTGLSWQQFMAGATASVLSIGALIAAGADPDTTLQDAKEIDRLYLSIGALTMLDSVVDLQEDLAAGRLGYVQYYDGPEEMASGLASVARDGISRARGLSNGAHHVVTLVGIVAYYASAPAASVPFARPVIARVRRELQPLIAPTLALMRAWRVAKRMRHRAHHRATRV